MAKTLAQTWLELLKKCVEIEGDFKIRVGMMNPMYLKDMINDSDSMLF